MKEKIKMVIKTTIEFLLNPRLLLCFGAAWFITNGWSYVMFAFGTYFEIGWMIAASGAYLAFLWLPISPEKIATVAIAIALLRFLFPRDEKTLAVLRDMYHKAKNALKRRKDKKEDKKEDA